MCICTTLTNVPPVSVFWANAGLGAASVPGYWDTFHSGDCTVHRTDIHSFSENNTILLRDSTRLNSDYVILSTGFDKSYQVFSPSLQRELGLVIDSTDKKLAAQRAAADQTVEELFPGLQNPLANQEQGRTAEATAGAQKLLHGPSQHYRRLIVPSLAAQGDRSIIFPGFIHSIYTPIVAEVQALWGVAFLLGLHDPPSLESMEVEVAQWTAWSKKRYGAQGQKHAYAIYDFIPVSISPAPPTKKKPANLEPVYRCASPRSRCQSLAKEDLVRALVRAFIST